MALGDLKKVSALLDREPTYDLTDPFDEPRTETFNTAGRHENDSKPMTFSYLIAIESAPRHLNCFLPRHSQPYCAVPYKHIGNLGIGHWPLRGRSEGKQIVN